MLVLRMELVLELPFSKHMCSMEQLCWDWMYFAYGFAAAHSCIKLAHGDRDPFPAVIIMAIGTCRARSWLQ